MSKFEKWTPHWERLCEIIQLFEGNSYKIRQVENNVVKKINGKYFKLSKPSVYEKNH